MVGDLVRLKGGLVVTPHQLAVAGMQEPALVVDLWVRDGTVAVARKIMGKVLEASFALRHLDLVAPAGGHMKSGGALRHGEFLNLVNRAPDLAFFPGQMVRPKGVMGYGRDPISIVTKVEGGYYYFATPTLGGGVAIAGNLEAIPYVDPSLPPPKRADRSPA